MAPELLFIAKHLIALTVIAAAAAGAGTLIAPTAHVSMRAALGLAVWGQILFLAALAGQLTTTTIALLFVLSLSGYARSRGNAPREAGWLAIPFGALFAVAFLVALQPPLAFDETLYHLPFVRALAESGRLGFLGDNRFPLFPQIQESLAAPMMLVAGDTATHLVALLETAVAAALLWQSDRRAGAVAAALFVGSPIVVHLGTITYAEAALTLFVLAGFACLSPESNRSRIVLSGFFFGTACSVKYLGFYFAAAAVILVFVSRRRETIAFIGGLLAGALPTTIWLVAQTGNPVFPFFPRLFGPTAWSIPSAPFVSPWTLPWDVTFARDRVNFQPPFTPLFILMLAGVLIAAWRETRARIVVAVAAGYVAIFPFLPRDSRYLVPLLPLISGIAAGAFVRRWPRAATVATLIAIAPGLAYAAYRVRVVGMPPATAAQREAVLARRIPEYAALQRARDGTVYVCGAEQLKYYAPQRLLGDHNGPYSYDRILRGDVAANLRRIGVRYLLVSKRVCPDAHVAAMVRVYEDRAAALWLVPARPSVR